MKIFNLVIFVAILFLFVAGISIKTFDIIEGDVFYRNQIYKQLSDIANSKSYRISSFINERKNDAIFLAGTKDVVNIFNEKLNYNVKLMQDKIKGISKQTAYDIEEYLLNNPNLTLEDLQNDEKFQKIAVRDVGETGYTYVLSMGEGVVYYHPDSNVRGKTYHIFKKKFPNIWKYNDEIAQSNPCEDSFGFYEWEDVEGKIREKFTYNSCIKGSTADNYSFFVGASTYLDEYSGSIQMAGILDSEFKYFQNKNSYHDIIFINLKGDVVWTSKKGNELGTNLIVGAYNESLLSKIFMDTKKNLETTVSESGLYGVKNELMIFVSSPVFDEFGEMIGVVVLEFNNKEIIELIKIDPEFESVGEIYIINKESRYLTPLKYDEYDEYDNSKKDFNNNSNDYIKSVGINNCLESYNNSYLNNKNYKHVFEGETYFNYASNLYKVLGSYTYISNYDWCIIVEMDENYFLSRIPDSDNISFIIIVFIVFIIACLSLILDNLFVAYKEVKK